MPRNGFAGDAMKRFFRILASSLLALPGFLATASGSGKENLGLASFEEVLTQPVHVQGKRIIYGPLPEQIGNLRIPAGAGKFPVVVLIHGGCWLADYDLSYMEPLASALTEQGYVTWNIEYRRLGDPDGGWPGTFSDVRKAAQFLDTLAIRYPLDLGRVSVVGHSSGGQLALWMAAESKHRGSNSAIQLRSVVSLAGITDLRTYRNGPPGSCHSGVDELLGGSPALYADRYENASPLERLPLGVRQFFIQGRRDDVVDNDSVIRYVKAARKAGDSVQLLNLDGGHFDVVMPVGPAFQVLKSALQDSLTLSR